MFRFRTNLYKKLNINLLIEIIALKEDEEYMKHVNPVFKFVEKKYLNSLKEFEKNFIDSAQKAMYPDKAAIQIIKVISKKNPKPRYIIAENKLTTFLPTLIPTRLFDKIVSKLFKMDYGN